jgi:hypothetical protein
VPCGPSEGPLCARSGVKTMAKNYATRLVDIIERLYIENMVYRNLVKLHQEKLPPQSEIDALMEFAKTDPRVGGLIHQQF